MPTRPDPFSRDSTGRTTLFDAAESGDMERVHRIIFSLAGTGLSCQRLGLIQIKDNAGLTASDVAAQSGHKEIARLLDREEGRMEFFE